MAPREISAARFMQLVKKYLPLGNILVGIAREPHIEGFDGQPQFRSLRYETIKPTVDKVAESSSPHKIYVLHYSQRESNYILQKLKLRHVVGINGSWKHSFHTQSAFYTLAQRQIAYELVSPFSDEAEAKAYEQSVQTEIEQSLSLPGPSDKKTYSEADMLGFAAQAARQSYDYSFQTGVALGKQAATTSKAEKKYTYITSSFNKVVPYQTFAMHFGASRETNFSPPHDLNHYDTVHAEVELLIQSGKNQINLAGTTVFINLLPCPHCARMLSETDVAEFVYREDHSDGYAITILEKAGKIVRRVVG